ncbi:hypothetical protein [Mycobacteroides abscessus]|uniref:hypothetical protein n=1 Tax=Mycobacteroides abscessus TaxID=36809 RepID=UPI000C26BA03|nr:hypothetical protein [Mycobacteroides abscessus]
MTSMTMAFLTPPATAVADAITSPVSDVSTPAARAAQRKFSGTRGDEQRVLFGENRLPGKVCRDCRTRKPLSEFPRDRYGRINVKLCHQCTDEHTAALLTETEAAQHMGVTLAAFRALGGAVAGSYTPRTGASAPLFSRERIEADRQSRCLNPALRADSRYSATK